MDVELAQDVLTETEGVLNLPVTAILIICNKIVQLIAQLVPLDVIRVLLLLVIVLVVNQVNIMKHFNLLTVNICLSGTLYSQNY